MALYQPGVLWQQGLSSFPILDPTIDLSSFFGRWIDSRFSVAVLDDCKKIVCVVAMLGPLV